MPQMLAIAILKVARTSPTLPPSAIRASAIARLFPRAGQHYADIVEDRGDRRVRLVDRNFYDADAGKRAQHGVRDRAGSALQQFVIDVLERRRRGAHHAGIGNGVHQAVGARGVGQVDAKLEVDHEALPDFGFVVHHAVAGVDHHALDEDGIGHRNSSIAWTTRKACTVSATSCVLMTRAPLRAATTCAAMDPPRRWSGSDGVTLLMKRL